jgi:hypothetical protein
MSAAQDLEVKKQQHKNCRVKDDPKTYGHGNGLVGASAETHNSEITASFSLQSDYIEESELRRFQNFTVA